jgi:uroporphyrinogen-III synthase
MLKTNGAAAVIRHPVYATTPPSQFNAQSVCHSDIVVLCSRSAADNLIRLHRDGVLSSLPAIVAIGSSTAAELRRQGIHHFETASQPTAAATAEAVFRLFARNQKRKHA